MKKLLLGTVALAALGMGAPAIAADMRVRPLPPPVPVSTWTGCHVGGTVGNSWGHSDGYSATGATVFAPAGGPLAAGTPIAPSFDLNGFTGGFYAGCDYQFGVWVIGVEGDWSTNNKEGQAFEFQGPPVFGAPAGFIDQAAERWFATARGRLGYAVDKWLLYVTGGGAWVKVDSREWAITAPIATATLQSDTRTGWTVGAGLEYALSYGWSIRSEYLYIQLPSYTTFTTGPFGPGSLTNQSAGKLTNNIWRAGLTYKFGDWSWLR
jgi:outer membrane immunogenic protein